MNAILSLVFAFLGIMLIYWVAILINLHLRMPSHLKGKKVVVTFKKSRGTFGQPIVHYFKPLYRECSPPPQMVFNLKKKRIEVSRREGRVYIRI